MLAIASSFVVLCYVIFVTKRLIDQSKSGFWFETMNHPIELSDTQWQQIFSYISECLDRGSVSEVPLLQDDPHTRMMFLSYSDGVKPAETIRYAEQGFAETLNQLITQLMNRKPSKITWMVLEIVSNVSMDINVNLVEPISIDLGIEGLALSHDAVYSPQMVVRKHLIDNNAEFDFNAINDDVIRGLIKKGSFDLYRFDVISAFHHDKVIPLYRGHRMYERLHRDDIESSLRLSLNYLTQALNDVGEFTYVYHAVSGTLSDDYSLVRHAGTITSLIELSQHFKDYDALEKAQQAITYLLEYAKPMPGFDDAMVIVENQSVKLGGVALSLLALVKYTQATNDKQYLTVMQQFAQYIIQIQQPNGRFAHQRTSYPEAEDEGLDSKYYPGESLIALLAYYQLTQHKPSLKTALRGCDYLIDVRDAGTTEDSQYHDHWLLMAINYIPQQELTQKHINHIKHICRAIVSTQHNTNVPFDWHGGYFDPPRVTPTATRNEGLAHALETLRRTNDTESDSLILTALEHGIRFQCQAQIREEVAMFMKSPQQAMGGFRARLTTFNIRIDYIQHNASAMMAYLRLMNSE